MKSETNLKQYVLQGPKTPDPKAYPGKALMTCQLLSEGFERLNITMGRKPFENAAFQHENDKDTIEKDKEGKEIIELV